LQATLDFLCEAESVSCPEPFPTELLDRLRALVPCEFVSYNELDQVRRRNLYYEECTNSRAVGDEPDASHMETFWQLKDQNPVCRHHASTLDFSALKLSDFLSRRQLHRNEYYATLLRPVGIEHLLVVGLPATLRHTKCFLLHGQRRDFDERDRAVVEVLRPHLPALYAAAAARRMATAIAVGEDVAGGIVVLSPSGAIDYETPAARGLLARFFPDAEDGRLPETVDSWRLHQTGRSNGRGSPPRPVARLTVRGDGSLLVIHRLEHTLLLSEEPASLTRREREIVDLLAEGRSNAEIASLLWIAPGTVRKHLENIYAKLGVRSRMAAVARLRRR
jgi:DNA-binding CsgD family transcriptional regulator